MKAELNSVAKAFLQEKEIHGFNAPVDPITVQAVRQRSKALNKHFSRKIDFNGKEEEIFVPSSQVPGGIPVTVYIPQDLPETPAILVYFHGGGWTIGSREGYESLCKLITSTAKCIVLNVEYRLAPEHRFPACNDDAKVVMEWTLQNKESVGGQSASPVGVCGDSAGGQISATVSYEVPGLSFQILIYPKVDERMDRLSYQEYHDDPILPHAFLQWFFDNWMLSEAHGDIRASPINETVGKNLPPALFIVAECDPLRDDSYDYEEKLRKAGIETELLLIPGTPHAFVAMTAHYIESCGRTVDSISRFISKRR